MVSKKTASPKNGSPTQLAHKILVGLEKLYPDAECELHYESPFQLLVATILSAQCTDERVNQVTPKLFQRYQSVRDFASAELSELEEMIRSTGFFRNKAKNIQGCAVALLEDHQGVLPQTMEELVELPGVGRKTANVVLGICYGVPGIVVDTHVKRLSFRWGLTQSTDPDRIEQDLMTLIPAESQTVFGFRTIQHGRKVCRARNPLCDECGLAAICPRCGVSLPTESN